ncbi:histone deacetylase [Kitasatospora sp. NPDC094015]|uniref:histone deacetylase n=1 Tax=Kitasatospora sp. NPDC094015 TaxID=3155205 RepID=UPI00333209A7
MTTSTVYRPDSRPDPPPASPAPDDRIWYAAYASNMLLARLTCYLAGGRLAEGDRDHPGSRDRRPPERSVPLLLPGRLHFALESLVWGGGMGFYDPLDEGELPARGYLLRAGQFADIAAQEVRRAPGTDLDLSTVLADGRAELGAGRYQTLLCVGAVAGLPVLTFTAPWRTAEAELNPPSARYLRVLAAGLREAHGWDADRCARYLSSRPGASGAWSAAGVRRALGATAD